MPVLLGQPLSDGFIIRLSQPNCATGPGVPSPIGWPSTDTTGMTSIVVPSKSTSSDAFNSSSVTCDAANGKSTDRKGEA